MSPRRKYVQLEENDDIYIECNPVDEKGDIIEENNVDLNNLNTRSLENNLNIDFGNNIGIQAVIGVSLMLFLYTLGDYIFKILPKNQINNRLLAGNYK
jgi:hypothetical protein